MGLLLWILFSISVITLSSRIMLRIQSGTLDESIGYLVTVQAIFFAIVIGAVVILLNGKASEFYRLIYTDPREREIKELSLE